MTSCFPRHETQEKQIIPCLVTWQRPVIYLSKQWGNTINTFVMFYFVANQDKVQNDSSGYYGIRHES